MREVLQILEAEAASLDQQAKRHPAPNHHRADYEAGAATLRALAKRLRKKG